MLRLPSLQGDISPLAYAIAAPALILSQHLGVALVFLAWGQPLVADAEFWLLPLRRLSSLWLLPSWVIILALACTLAVAWGLAVLSFRRASHSGEGHFVAVFAVVPALQIVAVAALICMPVFPGTRGDEPAAGAGTRRILQGVLAGVAIIVLTVLVSTVIFGSYGWGLFVLTPFVVGITTAYLANRGEPLPEGRTTPLVLASAAIGCLALVMFALEGIVCIVLAAPLGALVAWFGGGIGRALAFGRRAQAKPLMCVTLMLPAVFAVEAAMPPAVPIAMSETIEIAAPPAAVWRALVSSDPIATPPGLVARAGLAYAIRGRLLGEGVGAERLGEFSTGTARERVTEWEPGARLAFDVLSQPPAMAELSPYGDLHTPHVQGYFETTETRFVLDPTADGGTRLTASAAHVLRIEPVLYWEPMARWAVHANAARVLRHIKAKAERER